MPPFVALCTFCPGCGINIWDNAASSLQSIEDLWTVHMWLFTLTCDCGTPVLAYLTREQLTDLSSAEAFELEAQLLRWGGGRVV